MKLRVLSGGKLSGTCSVPGDKSISHRAALIASLAEGATDIYNYLWGADCIQTLQCLKKLGVTIEKKDGFIRIMGRGLDGLQEPAEILDAGNSGTTMRLLLGLLAGQDLFAVLTGDQSLCRRPMGRVITPLTMMGTQIQGDPRTDMPLLPSRDYARSDQSSTGSLFPVPR